MSAKTTPTCRRILSSLPLLFLVAGCTSIHPIDSHPKESEQRATERIERRLEELFASCVNKDFERLDSYHLYGPKFTRFSGSSPARLDAAATRQLEHKGLASLSGLNMRSEGLKVDVFGNMAVATMILHYSFNGNGGIIHRSERATLVFSEERGDWKIVHEHLSPITTIEP